MPISFEERLHQGVLSADGPSRALEEAIAAIESSLAPLGTCLYSYDERERLVAHLGRMRRAFVGDLSFEDDPCQDRGRQVDGPLVHATRLLPRRDYTASTAYREFYSPLGIEHIVCLRLNGLRHGVAGMWGLFVPRADDNGDFSDEDKRSLLGALPVLAALKSEQARQERMRRVLDGLAAAALHERQPVLMFSSEGELLWISRSGRSLLGARANRCIDEARDLITAMRNCGRRRGAFTVELDRGGSFALEVTRWEDGLFMGRLRPAQDPEARLAERYRLTPAEAAVLGCLGEGMSNLEIAETLSITDATAATHVKRVLAKLGVASRLQAALLMQREQMLYD